MIRITFEKRKENYVMLYVRGHANSADAGQDLICAAVSAISIGLCNAFSEMLAINTIAVYEDAITIRINRPNKKTNTMMEMAYHQLQTVAEGRRKFVKIEIMEE